MWNHLDCRSDELTGIEVCRHGDGCRVVANPGAAWLLSDYDPVVQSRMAPSFDESCVDESAFVGLLQRGECLRLRTADRKAPVDLVFQGLRLLVRLDALALLAALLNPTSCVGCDNQRQKADGKKDRSPSP